MKRILFYLAMYSVAVLLVSCGGDVQNGNVVPTMEIVEETPKMPEIDYLDSSVIANAAITLIDYMPNKTFDDSCRKAFVPEYYILLAEVWPLFRDEISNFSLGSILLIAEAWDRYKSKANYERSGYYDDLWSFGSHCWMCGSHPKTIHDIKILSDTTAEVYINYFHADHTMLLQLSDRGWLIADFDKTRPYLRDEIERINTVKSQMLTVNRYEFADTTMKTLFDKVLDGKENTYDENNECPQGEGNSYNVYISRARKSDIRTINNNVVLDDTTIYLNVFVSMSLYNYKLDSYKVLGYFEYRNNYFFLYGDRVDKTLFTKTTHSKVFSYINEFPFPYDPPEWDYFYIPDSADWVPMRAFPCGY